MKKIFLPLMLVSLFLVGCNNNPTNPPVPPKPDPGIPVFSKDSYSYDKNAANDLEMPVELNGVNIYACYFEDYLLSAKQAKYESDKKVLAIKESYMSTVDKGNYTLTVYYDEEVKPSVLNIEVMNSVKTRFDTATKKYTFGKTGDLKYDCDFSIATITSLTKGGITIPSTYYSYADNTFSLSSEVLDHCYGTSEFVLTLSNHDVYKFNVSSDILFFTDYDLTTIHSDVVSIYGANPLYQYATTESVQIVNAESYGMVGNALKYVPNNVEVELDCNSIMTLGDALTTMSWYKVGYVRDKIYSISFDYETIGSSNVTGQTFCFATITDWGAPFTYQEPLLMGPENDNKVHHFSVILTGNQIQSGTFIYAKWLRGSGYLLLDNFRVSEVTDCLEIINLPDYKKDSGDYVGTINAHGWKYDLLLDGNEVTEATLKDDSFIIPSSVMNNLSVGVHELVFSTSIGDVKATLTVTINGTAILTETSKTVTGKESSVKLSGTFNNAYITKVTKYGSNQYDVSNKDGQEVSKNDFSFENDGLVIQNNALITLYGTTTFKIDTSIGNQLTFTITNTTNIFYDDFNTTNVWPWDACGSSLNYTITQDTKMSSLGMVDGHNVLVYEPYNAEQDHAKNPSVCQNGIFTMKRDGSNPVAWEPFNFEMDKTYRFTLNYKIEGDNDKTSFIFYRWLTNGAEDKSNELSPNLTTWTFECKGGDFIGFHFCAMRSSQTDLIGYKVTISSFVVEAVR